MTDRRAKCTCGSQTTAQVTGSRSFHVETEDQLIAEHTVVLAVPGDLDLLSIPSASQVT